MNYGMRGFPGASWPGKAVTVDDPLAAFSSSAIRSPAVVPATSGKSVDFEGIPSWSRRVVVKFSDVSTSGSSIVLVRLGSASGGIETTGYRSHTAVVSGGATNTANYTNGFNAYGASGNTSSAIINGMIVFELLDGNTWTCNGHLAWSNIGVSSLIAGSKTLSDVLDRVRITTANGTDTVDAGIINISWE